MTSLSHEPSIWRGPSAHCSPPHPEVHGLLALLRLSEARRPARLDTEGALVLLEEQDRSTWDHEAAAEGHARLWRALRSSDTPGPYTVQAAIAAVHAQATGIQDTDWPQILALYDLLLARHPSPVATLARAMAVARVHGPHAGLEATDRAAADPRLTGSHLVPAARGELLLRLGRLDEAAEELRRAAQITDNPVERRSLLQRAEAHTDAAGEPL